MSGSRMHPERLLGYGAAAVTAACAVGAMIATDAYETVDGSLAAYAAVASIGLYAIVIVCVRIVSSYSATVRGQFWLLVALALVAAPTATIAAAYTLNAELDETAGMRDVELIEKGKNEASRATFSYAVIAPWPPHTEPLTLGVQGPTYQRLPESGPVRARIGDGWLGYVWVDDLWPIE